MSTPTMAASLLRIDTLRGQGAFEAADLFFGHTLAGFPPGNLPTTIRMQKALRCPPLAARDERPL